MPVSTLLADALKARVINKTFGTNYDAQSLQRLEDAHIEELLTAAAFLGMPDKPRAGGAGGIDTTQPEAF